MTPDDPNMPATDDAGSDDIVITDRQLFDQAIAPTPPPAPPSPEADKPVIPTVPTAAPQQPVQRDAQGRFVRPDQQQRPQQPPPQDLRTVPLREILDEREKRQRAETELGQMRQAWEHFMAQARAQQQPQQQQPQTIFDAPDQYLQTNVINPILQQMEVGRMRSVDGLSRAFANQQYRKEVVDAALAAITQIRYTPDGNHLYQQIMASGHPYGALVDWYQRARAHQAIGNNPQAWLQQRQQEWVRDPNAQRAVLEYIRQQQGQQRGNGQPPNVQLPPSLSTISATSGREEKIGDLSDQSLWAHALGPPRR